MTILSANIPEFLQRDPSNLPDGQPAFLEHLLAKMDAHIVKKGKILLLTLTKRSSEEITNFLVSK
jgi:excinuclease UvrABC helicase subunit UvrB